MSFGVFIHRTDSIYDDTPSERYHFPGQYLDRVRACVGDWIIYYEPAKVSGSRGYFAVAKVQEVIPDPRAPRMYFALLEPGSYLDFANPVPFRGPAGVTDRSVLNSQGKISGRAQSAVRPISSADFHRIIAIGLRENLVPLSQIDSANPPKGLSEEGIPFEQERDRIVYFASRIVRDRVFRHVVLRAYDSRCAITGLKLINGGGRAEAEAAHIRPVEVNGPDIVNNGIALSGTVHWMFDRGLISLADDLKILVSRHVNDPDSIRALINNDGVARTPSRAADRPHPHFLQWHRENRFKN